MFCFKTGLNTEQLQQSPGFTGTEEGKYVTMHCSSSVIYTSMQWYRQEPGGSPVFLVTLVRGGEMKEQERLITQFGKERKNSSLSITRVLPEDTGTYFCAGAQHSGGTCCLHPNP